jgi:ribonuclease-3
MTLNNGVIVIACMIAMGWAWGSLGVMQRNYNLQKELDDKKRELIVSQLAVANQKLEQRFYNTSEYKELAVRESLGLGLSGEALGYEPLVRMSKGEKNGSDRARLQILANAFEAVVGAIYLEFGYDTASDFIHKNIIVKLDDILRDGSWRDPKSHLQEVSQRIDGHTPIYRVLEEDGPDHDKVFTLGVFVGEKQMGQGTGPSKQAAQQAAAKAALEKYQA